MRSKFNGHELKEVFTVEVMEGKKKVLGKLEVDCSLGVWPMGEWIPTEPIEEKFELGRATKKEKFDGSPGKVSLTYCYAGNSKPCSPYPALLPSITLPACS